MLRIDCGLGSIPIFYAWDRFPYVLAFRLANATPTHASHRLRLGIDSHFYAWDRFPHVLAFRLANATPTHASHRLRLGIDSHFLRLGSIPSCVGISRSVAGLCFIPLDMRSVSLSGSMWLVSTRGSSCCVVSCCSRLLGSGAFADDVHAPLQRRI